MTVAVIGKIINLVKVENSDNLSQATVVCGRSGKWRGVVRTQSNFSIGDLVEVYLPDAVVPNIDRFAFMQTRKYRVSMARFRGAYSESLIMPTTEQTSHLNVGDDIANIVGVYKYEKPIPADSIQIGKFPEFSVPKTDEPHLQAAINIPSHPVATIKFDGTSLTLLWSEINRLIVCSRNYIVRGGVYDAAAEKINLKKYLELYPKFALQCEVVGPKIQTNSAGFNAITPVLFYVFDTVTQEYLSVDETVKIARELRIPVADSVRIEGDPFDIETYVKMFSHLRYANGNQIEGVVVREIGRMERQKPSFKVINYDYGH